jgi:hypothetical protein
MLPKSAAVDGVVICTLNRERHCHKGRLPLEQAYTSLSLRYPCPIYAPIDLGV